jgi:hypothetical protein
MGAPALAEAQPVAPGTEPALSPKDHDDHDSELWPSVGVAAFMLAGAAGALRTIGKAIEQTQA